MRSALTQHQFPFLGELSEEGRRSLRQHSATRAEPKRLLLSRGDPVDGAYLLVGGSLRVFYLTAEGREATLYHVEPGGTCILALTSTFNQQAYPAWVQSGPRGASMVRVPSAPFRRLFDTEPAFRAFIFSVLSGRVFELMQALEEAGSAQLEQRVARLLLRRSGGEATVEMTQAAIASELGSAREVVFRALRTLSAKGLVRRGRARVQLLDVAGLRDAAS